jgi:hypothetical protein
MPPAWHARAAIRKNQELEHGPKNARGRLDTVSRRPYDESYNLLAGTDPSLQPNRRLLLGGVRVQLKTLVKMPAGE